MCAEVGRVLAEPVEAGNRQVAHQAYVRMRGVLAHPGPQGEQQHREELFVNQSE